MASLSCENDQSTKIMPYFLGVDIKEVQEIVETHLKNMLLKHFDPKKADSIFSDEGAVRD